MREALLKAEWLTSDTKERRDLQTAGADFTRQSEAVVALLAEGRLTEVAAQRETALRPVFERYVTAITTAADLLYAESERTSNELTSKAGSMAALLLGVASWPLILFAGVIALTALFVLVLMILFRGRDADMP